MSKDEKWKCVVCGKYAMWSANQKHYCEKHIKELLFRSATEEKSKYDKKK